MKTQEAIDKAFEALSEIKTTLERQVRTLDEQIRRAQLEYLENAFQQQKDALEECLDGIDQQLIKLSVYIEEYQRLHQSLKDMNEKQIPELGGTSPAIPEPIAGDTLAAVLAGRLDYLKSQGKI